MKAVSLLVLVCALICGAIGCGNSSPSLVGKWEQTKVKSPVNVEFSADEMYLTPANKVIKFGKYKFVDKDTIEIELSDMGKQILQAGKEANEKRRKLLAEGSEKEYVPQSTFVSNTLRYAISVVGDEMTMTESGEQPSTYKKIK